MLRKLNFVNLTVLLAATVLLIFVVLTGATKRAPFDKMYWSQVQLTSATSQVPAGTYQWTNYDVCRANAQGASADCTDRKFAYQYDPLAVLGASVPGSNKLSGKQSSYKTLSKVGFILLLVALILAVVFLPLVFLSICCASRFFLGLGFLPVFIGAILALVGAILETYVHVSATKAFSLGGLESKIGATVFGLVWGAVAAYLLSLGFTVRAFLHHGGAARGVDHDAYDSDGK